MNYIDIHSHLSFPEFDTDRDEVVGRMREVKVSTITVGVDLASSRRAVEIAEQYPEVHATVGQHPVDAATEAFDPKSYEALVAHPKTVAVGECGLDYYRMPASDPGQTGGGNQSDKKRQQEVFEQQIEFSLAHNKPLMLHGRPAKGSMDAYEDMLEIVRHYPGVRGDVHFFAGNVEIARRFLDLNFTLSFTGVITFARDYDKVVQYAPLKMIHAETDAPYAAPAPFRGTRAEPMHVVRVVERIAELKNLPLEEVRAQLIENANRLFFTTIIAAGSR